jgi:SSS family transporter
MAGTFGTLNYVILFIYLGFMLLIGVLFAGKQKTTDDYFLAGRKMPWLVVGMSMFASLTSASTYLGVPAVAYKENIAILFGVMVSPLAAPFLIRFFYPFYHRLKVTTSYEYILHRFGAGARYTVAGLFVLSRIGWLGVVIYAPALAFSVVTGVELWISILLMGVLATIYTALGGLSAVLWTDMIQFVILVFGAVWVVFSLINGMPENAEPILETAKNSGRLDVFDFGLNLGEMTALAAMINWFLIFISDYGTDQITVQRLLSCGNVRGTSRAVIFNSINDVVINSILLFIGLGLLAWFRAYPERLPSGAAPDRLMPIYIIRHLPNGISGLVITAVFAAAMSSMDSGINSLATVTINDFVNPLKKSPISQAGQVALARILTAALGLFATGAAFYASTHEHIVAAWSVPLSLFGGPVLALFLLGIFTRRGSFRAWVISAVVVVCGMVLIQNNSALTARIHWVYYFPISSMTTLLLSVIISITAKTVPCQRGLTIWHKNNS